MRAQHEHLGPVSPPLVKWDPDLSSRDILGSSSLTQEAGLTGYCTHFTDGRTGVPKPVPAETRGRTQSRASLLSDKQRALAPRQGPRPSGQCGQWWH